ncbi:MAG: deoxyguanosinetriphosphate triphosphohydrolase [Prolixibacteraceae bacterium]|nr:deoxyguanosinetriphosphate triphosphohydrolase [Prolixibacteraceae bacterium]MBN2648154.1 deoxyguanosinetriphosphate triphosphohydrolase [Prolixibacteraceae bacterium]
MNWNQLLSIKRLGKPTSGKLTPDARTQFQRDYDRLIFSSPFRRLQNKTQVFPLPGSIFVHNRLTHSLEVASVGRSLGNIISMELEKKGESHPLLSEIGSVVAAACLAHDMGNPPFGHSGEDAIKAYFETGNGQSLKNGLSDAQWRDLIYFDGNANAFRVLSHQFRGRRTGGFALTYTMLASIVKYPWESVLASKPKFGFFQSEKETFKHIAHELGLVSNDTVGIKFSRHPLVYLVEAADDICYQIMDVEDAHKLKILSYNETKALYLNFYHPEKDAATHVNIQKTFQEVTDPNEQIAYLRAGVINKLIFDCVQVFLNNYSAIMDGSFSGSLIDQIPETSATAMKQIVKVSVKRIYSDSSVLEIELAGYKVISTLTDHFINAVLTNSKYNKKLMTLFPEQFLSESDDKYSKIQSVVDFVSGMTDVYALDLYRKITGISIPGI